MNVSASAPVCVIVAAKDSSASVGRAVQSALAEPQVGEVLVVDDGSRDDTANAARRGDDGSGRLRVVRFVENRGPAAARNSAIDLSSAPLIAILDADDIILKGRFARLLDGADWDFAADNILFSDGRDLTPAIPDFAPEPSLISLEGFVAGNITRRGHLRGELGFLKPVMRREFLERHGLRYDETLRLGEDYDLYARALLRGARFRVVRSCGYGATVRADSLSGRHDTADLRRLWAVDRALLASTDLPPGARSVLARHAGQIRARYELREFLDVKRAKGSARAALRALARPTALPAVLSGILADKRRAWFGGPNTAALSTPRYLLPGRLAMGD